MSQGFLLTTAQIRFLAMAETAIDKDAFIESYANAGKTGPLYVEVGDAALVVLENGDAVATDSERIAA